MLRQPMHNFIRLSFIRFCLIVSCVALISAPLLNAETLSYRSYTAPEGTHYIAFGLQAPEQPAQQPPEVVFLIDTAASQMGQARRDTLEAVVSAINQLPEGSKVQILAMDVETEPLTTQFAVKGSSELEAALRTLYRRVPLGATDFGKGLLAARNAFEGGSADVRRSVLYFGSGRSMAKPLTPVVFEQEAKNFNEQKIPFTVCAVGLQKNLGFTAAFANRTGGNLIDMSPIALAEEAVDWEGNKVSVDWNKVDWKKIGKQIADSTTATVVWVDPDSVQFPENVYVFPERMQPIRSDRATVLVAAAETETLPAFHLALAGEAAEGKVALPFQLSAAEQKASDNFLQVVVEIASGDGGALMPLVGWDSLLHVQEMFIANIENQINKADAAMVTKNWREAQVILEDVLRVEPNNKIARNMFNVAAEEQQVLANVTAQNGSAIAETTVQGPVTAPSPAYVDAARQAQTLSSQKVNNEVQQAISAATTQMKTTHPSFNVAIQDLKLTQQMVRSNTVLAPAERDTLLDRLGNTLKQVEHEKYVQEYRDIEAERDRAKQRSLQEDARVLDENQEKTIQVFSRWDALMRAEEYTAAWAVGDHAVELMPDHPAPYIARRMAQIIKYTDEYEKLRHKRHVGFLESFMDAERTFIPVPAEPPITYIDRDRWLLLSNYRKEKYSTVTLADPDETVKTINAILENRDIHLIIDDTTTFSDLFRMIKDELRRLKLPDIHVELDRRALQDANETRSDSLVLPPGETFDYPKLRFRSILRRLLSPLDLTYIIRDETLLITTVQESQRRANMIIKVYPIADIYMLENSSMMGGGGYGGGGYGGMMGGGYGGGGYGGNNNSWGGNNNSWGGSNNSWGGNNNSWGGNNNRNNNSWGGNNSNNNNRNRNWSVPDEITRSNTTPVQQLTQNARSAEDCNAFWTDHFAQENVDHELVHDVVRQLGRAMKSDLRNADQVIALVEAAILSGNAQPWMYEALTLSLYLKGAPKPQILRAALSAADFCREPVDLLNIGFVMREALDLEQYVFPLYQQALENMPPERGLFAATQRLALELYNKYDDEGSLRWIGLAIISQEWDGELGRILTLEANDNLAMLKNRLIRQGRNEEAIQLVQEIQDAKLRDVVVTVEWTGDAGIDLMVREPSNSLCWFKNPRSASGGLLKTAPVANPARISNQSAVRRVSYIVPQGFNGKYSLFLNKSWGTLSNDLVRVTVETDVVPGEGKSKGVPARMHPEGIEIEFTLETGRRTESVSEAELEVADVKMGVAQQIVERNTALWRLIDDGVLGQATTTPTTTTPTTPTATASTVPTLVPVANASIADYLYGGRYIGYAPVVEAFDAGVTMEMQPVAVSPDRRYVLMTINQSFDTLVGGIPETEL